MDILQLAEALGIDTACDKEEVQYLREYHGVGIRTAMEIIIRPKVYEEIKLLVKYIKESYQVTMTDKQKINPNDWLEPYKPIPACEIKDCDHLVYIGNDVYGCRIAEDGLVCDDFNNDDECCMYRQLEYYKEALKVKEQECENYKQLAAKHCTETINMQREIDQLKTECERSKWYLNQIRDEELSHLDIEWDEYETHCIDTEYSNIITLVEEALEEISPEDCRYKKDK